ncbi:unnamed protein product [Brassica rapa subsp. trilocularis]
MWSLAQQVDEEVVEIERSQCSRNIAWIEQKSTKSHRFEKVEFACGFNDFVQAVQNTDEYPSLQYQVMEMDLYLDDWWLVFEHQQTKELHSLIKMLLSGL